MKKIIIFLATALLATSCVDMDVPPKNVVTANQLLSDESGIDIYMARLYSYMPYEDFKYHRETKRDPIHHRRPHRKGQCRYLLFARP